MLDNRLVEILMYAIMAFVLSVLMVTTFRLVLATADFCG